LVIYKSCTCKLLSYHSIS